jgi:hypothetical protein
MKQWPSQEQTEALWLSAEHWLENWQAANGDSSKSFSIAAEDCACCRSYFQAFISVGPCSLCPIHQYTGQHLCNDTPYSSACFFSPFSVDLEYRFLVCLALGEDPKQDPVLSTNFYN